MSVTRKIGRRASWSALYVLWAALVMSLAASATRAADDAAAPPAKWHHGPSPYRASYTVAHAPNHARAGYYLEVPDFGLGAGGEAIWAFDSTGAKLDVWTVGPGRDNGTLVLVGADRGDLTPPIYAYFGGDLKPPQARGKFTPGLRLTVRACEGGSELKTWEESKRIYDASTVIGTVPVRRINHAENPFDATDAIVMQYDGYILTEKAETRHYLLASDDAGYLFVNDEQVITRNGRHYAHDVRGQDGIPVALKAGPNPMRCLVIDAGGGQTAVLVRWLEKRKFHPAEPEEFVVSGITKLEQMEARGDRVCPAYRVTLISYMSIPEYEYTEVELSTYTGQSVQWRLANGARGEGPSCRFIVVGLDNVPARARHDRHTEAVGQITFATVPRRYTFQDVRSFAQYVQVIGAQDPADLDDATLRAYATLLTGNQRESRAIPVLRELASRIPTDTRQLTPEQISLLMDLARAAAATEPEVAREAYRRRFNLDRQLDPKTQRAQFLEYVEFELFRQSDPEIAAKTIDQAAKFLGPKDPMLAVYRAILLVYRGEHDAARQAFADQRATLIGQSDPRALQVQATEALERLHDFARQGFYAEAEAWWRRWILANPGAMDDGQFALVTAQLFQRLGWHDAGIRLIDRMLAYHDLPAFLPDLEFRRAELHAAAGHAETAAKLYRAMAETYPNHPLAPIATARLKAD